MLTLRRCIALLLLAALARSALCADEGTASAIGVDEQLGRHLPPDLIFTDQRGRQTPLVPVPGDGKPIVIIPSYYRCPQLCGLVLESMMHAAQSIDWIPGRDYHLVAISFDGEDHPAQALQKQASVLAQVRSDMRFTEAVWPFLSGNDETITRLLHGIGERVHQEMDGTIAHPAVAIVLTPDGTVSRYLYGISLRPLDLKLALLEASAGRSGPSLDRILLYCYRYDPSTRRYGLFITRFLQVGGVGAALIAALGISWLVSRIRISQA